MASAQSLATCCELQIDGSQGGHAGASQDNEGDMGDVRRVCSVSPSPVDLPGATLDIQPRGFTLWDGDSADGEPHHPSPLECITELEEVEEPQTTCGSPLLKPGERTAITEYISQEVGVLSKSILSTGDTHDEREKLKSPTADVLRCPKDTSVNGFFTAGCSETQAERAQDEEDCGSMVESEIHPEKEGSKWTESCEAHCDVVIEESPRRNLDSPVLSADELQDPKLLCKSHQKEPGCLCSEQTDSSEGVQELSSQMKNAESHIQRVQQLEMQDSSLIEVLTECKSKVEQLEELKSTSMDLKIQLQAAQGTAAFLQRKVLILEEAHRLKQQEVLELTVALQEAREALQEKSAEATLQLQALTPGTGGKQEDEARANGHAVTYSPPQPHQDSKVCTLL